MALQLHRVCRTLVVLALIVSISVPSVRSAGTAFCGGVFRVEEGGTSTERLQTRFSHSDCSGVLSYKVLEVVGGAASFPNPHDSTLVFTPAPSAGASAKVHVGVFCDLVKPLCNDKSYVVYRIETTTTPTPQPEIPKLSCSALPEVTVPTGNESIIHPMQSVVNCSDPMIILVSQSSGATFSIDNTSQSDPLLIFAAQAVEGVFDATVEVTCPLSQPTSCIMKQNVIVYKEITPELPDCTAYSFSSYYNVWLNSTITVNAADASLCPKNTDSTFTFAPTSNPRANPSSFSLSPSGEMRYLAPAGPPPLDSFTFTLSCAAPGIPSTSLCKATARIYSQKKPFEPNYDCSSNFDYTYSLNEDGNFTPNVLSFAMRASTTHNTMCPGGAYTGTSILSAPTGGSLTATDEGDIYTYVPTNPVVGMRDSVQFSITCSSNTSYVCRATASISITAAPIADQVHHVRDNTIICKGTCDVSSEGRKDGRKSGTVEVDFTEDGKLRIRAYSTVGTLAADFVSFSPIGSGDSLLTSQSFRTSSHVSFERECLDLQSTYGVASNVVNSNGSINALTDNYMLGDNYYQKFGGKHRHCDTYRANACKYAPFMSPTVVSSSIDVAWRVYINDCDATWVGEATVSSLRALQQADGTPTFTLSNDSTRLTGTLYVQTITPVDVNDPEKGFTTSVKLHDLIVTMRNTIVADVTTTLRPPSGETVLVPDIQYAIGKDSKTKERLYAYSIILFPSTLQGDRLVPVNTTRITITSFHLVSFNITSPNHVDCSDCTGTRSVCIGTGAAFGTDCGDEGIVRFEPISMNMEYDQREESPGGVNLFPSTSIGQRQFYNVTFAMRAVGHNSASTAGAYPVGVFTLSFTFSNGQTTLVEVVQEDYISEINSRNLRTNICRSSAYWPVADALGSSVPVKPFDGLALAGLNSTNPHPAAKYGPPSRLTNVTMCALPITSGEPVVVLSNNTGTIQTEDGPVQVSMCAVEEERTYGVTDWVMISIPSVYQSISDIHDEIHEQIIQDTGLQDDYYTTAELDYLLLSVAGSEVTTKVPARDGPSDIINILLDGNNPPSEEVSEELAWMNPGGISNARVQYYSWEEHATFLNYRRVRYTHQQKEAFNITSEPFNFAFIPGALLHANSSVRVPVYIKAAIRFTTYAKTNRTKGDGQAVSVVVVNSTEERLFYIVHVSRTISAALRFDVDAYEPTFVRKTTKGLGKTSATALFIVLSIAIVMILLAATYIEITYRRRIRNAKYHPKRPESAVGIHYGVHGEAVGGTPSAAVRDATPSTSSLTNRPDGTIKTKFGAIGVEQKRVPDLGDSPTPSESGDAAPAATLPVSSSPQIGDEQTRVHDDEVADL